MRSRQRGPKRFGVGSPNKNVACFVTENLAIKSDFYRNKQLAKLSLPIGSLPERTFSRNGEEGRQEFLNFCSFMTKSSARSWGKRGEYKITAESQRMP